MAKIRTAVGGNTTQLKKIRPPMVDRRDRLWFPEDPTKHRIIVTEGLLRDHLDSGFRHVTYEMLGGNLEVGEGNINGGSDMGAYVSWNVGRAEKGDNVRGYLLEMDIDDWKELKKEINEIRQEPVSELTRSMEEMKKAGFYGSGLEFR